jgi:hypothetical protein
VTWNGCHNLVSAYMGRSPRHRRLKIRRVGQRRTTWDERTFQRAKRIGFFHVSFAGQIRQSVYYFVICWKL